MPTPTVLVDTLCALLTANSTLHTLDLCALPLSEDAGLLRVAAALAGNRSLRFFAVRLDRHVARRFPLSTARLCCPTPAALLGPKMCQRRASVL